MTDRAQVGQPTGLGAAVISLAVFVVVADAVIRRVPSNATFTEVCGGGCGASPFGLVVIALLVVAASCVVSFPKWPSEEGGKR